MYKTGWLNCILLRGIALTLYRISNYDTINSYNL